MTLEDLTQSTYYWSNTNGRYFSISATRERYEIQWGALSQIHPNLPELISEQIRQCPVNHGRSFAEGPEIRATLTLLTKGSVELTNTLGDNFNMIDIVKFYKLKSSENKYLIEGAAVKLSSVNLSGVDLLYASEVKNCFYIVYEDVLERKYPGFKVRLQLGEDLGIPREELFQQVFTAPQPIIPSLSEIRFE